MQTEVQLGRDLRRGLEELGPLFAAFGRYLSARVDLLPYGLCQDLAGIPDRAPPVPPEQVRAIFYRELGASPDQAFQWFDASPYESRLFWQSHRAHLSGNEVVVRLVRPAIAEWIEQAENIEAVAGMLAACGVRPNQIRTAGDEFRHELEARRNFENELESFVRLERDADSSNVFTALRMYRHLSTPNVLVHERTDPIAGVSPPSSPDQARMLCLAWLRQALEGEVFAVEPHRENLGMAPDGRIVFLAGPFATLTEQLKIRIGGYLAAAASQDTNAAYSHFAQVVSGGAQDARNEELRRRFLQMVAFRDGFGNDSREVGPQLELPPFSEEVLIHWRLAQEHAQPGESVNAFFRGLYHAVKTAGAMAPGRDSVLEALYELRIQRVFIEARDLLRPSEIAGLIEQYATTFLSMPSNVDDFLDWTSGHSREPGARQPTHSVAQGERYAAAVSLLLGFGAVALLLHRVGQSASSPVLAHVLAVLSVGFGLIFLYAGGRLS